jgi:hypothetical protein
MKWNDIKVIKPHRGQSVLTAELDPMNGHLCRGDYIYQTVVFHPCHDEHGCDKPGSDGHFYIGDCDSNDVTHWMALKDIPTPDELCGQTISVFFPKQKKIFEICISLKDKE